ncbi:MAG: PilN domain-containing protein [Desulfobacteraceae bacterium]|nr:PilN domain-containing protein [Desulfobacteraceae bacterium]
MDAIKINLATFDFRYQRIARLVLIGVAAFVLLVSVNAIRIWFQNQGRLAAHRQKIERLESSLAEQRGQQKARADRGGGGEPEKIENNIIRISRLVARDVFPFDRLLDMLEANLPDGVHLGRLEANETIGAVLLEGVAESMDRVTVFVNQLESLEEVSRIALSKLTFQDEKDGNSAPGPQQISFVIEGNLALETFLPAETYGHLASILKAPIAASVKEK